MATTEKIKGFKNINIKEVNKSKEWIRNNPKFARLKENEVENFNIEVFSSYNHEEIANDLYNALINSGFLEKYALVNIRIDPME
jgi:hypothetical protein